MGELRPQRADTPAPPGSPDAVQLSGSSERVAHQLPVHEVVLLLETDAERGLSEAEAQERLLRFGANTLPTVRRYGALIRFLLQFHIPLI